jgi:hypothetical protein
MRALCIFFVFCQGQDVIDFANTGFLDALFTWFAPMLPQAGSELIDAVRLVFQAGCDNPELHHWLELTVWNQELLEALDDFQMVVYAPMAPEVYAHALLDELRGYLEQN